MHPTVTQLSEFHSQHQQPNWPLLNQTIPTIMSHLCFRKATELLNVYASPFSSNACLELREQELVMEAVDRGDVGEDPCNDVLRDWSLCELSAKYLQRNHATDSIYTINPQNPGFYLWSRHVNIKTNISMLFICTHIKFFQLWHVKCDQKLDVSQLKFNCWRATLEPSCKLYKLDEQCTNTLLINWTDNCVLFIYWHLTNLLIDKLF